jgi:hypothetical protein
MSDELSAQQVPATVKIVGAAVMGAVGGLAVVAGMLGSVEFGIFGAVGGAVVAMIGTLSQLESSEA